MVRFKNRYITVEIEAPDVPVSRPLYLKSRIFHESVMSKLQQLHGDFGIAAVRNGFLTKYCNDVTRIAIIRVRHGPHKYIITTLPFITKIGKLDMRLKTLHVGATLKHSFKFIQKHQRAYLDSEWSKLKTDEERHKLEAAVMDFTKTDVSVNLENIV
ncbi:ribonuclease P/MRP protein subunit POP5 [Achroia grisella]|uniref:ribonuclease P/MRP protein subunit POP5 n=1 Tax=Achroia grisella TaxID=688607 RepID=UPI0027D2A916|nr:ribonuclease P/MRP protein subunit POP5 [Achroia grisella]